MSKLKRNVSIYNIYYMLQYVWGFKDKDLFENVDFSKELVSDRFLWEILYVNLKKLERYGIKKGYKEIDEIGTNIRGKINFQNSVKSNLMTLMKLEYGYDIFDEDIIDNKIIKATINLLNNEIKLNEDNKSRNLKKDIILFKNKFLSNIADIRLDKKIFNTLNYTRDNVFGYLYKIILLTCHFIFLFRLPRENDFDDVINKIGIKSDQDWGIFFEEFIIGFYRYHHREIILNINVGRENSSWNLQGNKKYLPVLKTDLIINIKSINSKIVYECKFGYGGALNKNKKFHSSHLYQIYSYIMNMKKNNEKITGVLLYAEVNDQMFERYEWNGIEIYVITVNLNQNADKINKRLIGILNDMIQNNSV